MENKGTTPNSAGDKKPVEKKKSNTLAIILGLLFLISLGLGIILFVKNIKLQEELVSCESDIDASELERERIIGSLNEMDAQYTELSEKYKNMSDEMLAEKEKIKKLLEQAKNKDWTIHKLKKETETLREIMKGYLVTIDSLNTLNQNLTAENTNVKEALDKEKEYASTLEEEKNNLSEKVKLGSLLQVVGVAVTGQNVKSNGTHKDTEKASRTEVIKCCFTVAENKIAQSGKRKIYMRIISPFGAILGGQKDDEFEVKGRKSVFTHAKEIDYQNNAQDVCMYWESDNEITSGKYIIQLYTDGIELGNYALTLK